MLTFRQKQILDFVQQNINKRGVAPTHHEIARHFKLSSVATIHEHLKALENKGYLTKLHGQARAVSINSKGLDLISIPLLGTIAAGEPIEAIEIKETIAIPKSKITAGSEVYALRVSGKSMIEDDINDGDVVIIRDQSTAENGQKIVALIDKNEATLKKYYKEKGRVRLQPANSELEPIYIHPSQLTIQGIVVDIIKQPDEQAITIKGNESKFKVSGTSSNKKLSKGQIKIFHGDAIDFYDKWESPTVIISDGPYGISGFPGDPPTHEELAAWYEPHIEKWSEKASPQTTLWFWNTEVGWATVHPILVKHGWRYRNSHIWDKGIGHIAGNVNGNSIRKLPVVTEVCIQYTKDPSFEIDGTKFNMKEWLRHEWSRTGLVFSKTNEACGVKDAATRKYFTLSHLWYFPPAEAFEKIQRYANTHGKKTGKPYFSVDGKKPISKDEWVAYRAKFNYSHGVTNVWHEPTVNGKERLRNGSKSLHLNQKPLKLMNLIIQTSSDPHDLIWEPFGGLCTGMISAAELDRKGVACEINKEVQLEALKRFDKHFNQSRLDLQQSS